MKEPFDGIDSKLTLILIMGVLVALALAIGNLAMVIKNDLIPTLTSRISVDVYPDPVCESCGKILDREHECVPEGGD